MRTPQLVTLYRGFLAEQRNRFRLPISQSHVNIEELYQKQESTGIPANMIYVDSPYVDKLLWATSRQEANQAAIVAYTRYLTRLSLEPAFRAQQQKNPTFALPAIAIMQAAPNDIYAYTEGRLAFTPGREEKLYRFSDSRINPLEENLVAQRIQPGVHVQLANPIRMLQMNGLLNEQIVDGNHRVAEGILYGVGFEANDDTKALIRNICYESAGSYGGLGTKIKSLYEVINESYTYALEKITQTRRFTPNQVLDIVARSLQSIMDWDNEKPMRSFGIKPIMIEGPSPLRLAYQRFTPIREIRANILERQETALRQLGVSMTVEGRFPQTRGKERY